MYCIHQVHLFPYFMEEKTKLKSYQTVQVDIHHVHLFAFFEQQQNHNNTSSSTTQRLRHCAIMERQRFPR